jgi:hypothetical protein
MTLCSIFSRRVEHVEDLTPASSSAAPLTPSLPGGGLGERRQLGRHHEACGPGVGTMAPGVLMAARSSPVSSPRLPGRRSTTEHASSRARVTSSPLAAAQVGACTARGRPHTWRRRQPAHLPERVVAQRVVALPEAGVVARGGPQRAAGTSGRVRDTGSVEASREPAALFPRAREQRVAPRSPSAIPPVTRRRHCRAALAVPSARGAGANRGSLHWPLFECPAILAEGPPVPRAPLEGRGLGRAEGLEPGAARAP